MRALRFGRTNAVVSAIALGTWGHGGPNTNEGVSVGWSGHDDTEAKQAIVTAFKSGITHWDTADAYATGSFGRGEASKQSDRSLRRCGNGSGRRTRRHVAEQQEERRRD